jgi:hypothetical protein
VDRHNLEPISARALEAA